MAAAARLWTLSVMLLTVSCTARRSSTIAEVGQQESIVVKLPIPYFDILPPPVGQDPAISKCFESLQNVHTCASDVFASFLSGQILIGADCCKVFEGLADNCVSVIFPFVPANPSFGNLIDGFCSALTGGAPGAPPPTLHGAIKN